MPSNLARALSATPITRARSNEPSYWKLTLTPVTSPPLSCPTLDATDQKGKTPVGPVLFPPISFRARVAREVGRRVGGLRDRPCALVTPRAGNRGSGRTPGKGHVGASPGRAHPRS